MTDDWNEFKKLISQDKAVERCKKVKNISQPIKSLPNRQIIHERIIPIQSLIRDIFIDDRRSVERGILDRLSRGSHPIDIAIDLHGYKVEDAYKAFYNALLSGIKNNLRLMLVITGKGDRSGYSIRSQLMKWVNIPEISSYIIYMSEAHQKHGGDGAFYLVLRRKRF